MSLTIMCGLLVVAFTFKNDQVNWLWAGHKPIAIILGFTVIVLGTQWIKYQRLLNNTRQK